MDKLFNGLGSLCQSATQYSSDALQSISFAGSRMEGFFKNAAKRAFGENDAIKPTAELNAKNLVNPDGRVVVFHGGFLDDVNSHPKKLREAWQAHGVSEQKMITMPNCYQDMTHPFKLAELPENAQGVLTTGSLVQDAIYSTCNTVKGILNSTYNLFAKVVNYAGYQVGYAKAVATCLDQYSEMSDSKSKLAQERAETLDKLVKARGYSKDKPAEISFVGHSGAGAVGAVLSELSNKPDSPYAFKVVELTTLGSPMTETFLSKIPKQVELNYVMSENDKLYKDVVTASRALVSTRNFIFGQEGESHYKIVDDLKPFLGSDDQQYLSGNPCHRSYERDKALLKKLIPDTLKPATVK